jgi:hypothetical protein
MRFSLHIFFALAAFGLVVTAAVMGAQQGGFQTGVPGDPGQFQQASNTIAR